MEYNFNYLDCFLVLAENLNFSETAKFFSVSQPCITRQIKLLEEQLHSRLFIRDNHSVHLTEEGKKLRAEISPLMKEMKSVLSSTRSRTTEMEGLIKFGCLSEIGQSTFIHILVNFQKLYPKMRVNLSLIHEAAIYDQVKKGELDFGIVPTPYDSENIRAFEIMDEKSVIVTSSSNKKDFTNIEDSKFIACAENDHLLTQFLRKYFKHVSYSKLNIQLIVNAHRAMIEAIIDTNHYAIMPQLSVEWAMREGKLRIASNKELKNKLYLIYRDNFLMEQKNSILKKYIIDSCKKL